MPDPLGLGCGGKTVGRKVRFWAIVAATKQEKCIAKVISLTYLKENTVLTMCEFLFFKSVFFLNNL
jgi:hypothetical protein